MERKQGDEGCLKLNGTAGTCGAEENSPGDAQENVAHRPVCCRAYFFGYDNSMKHSRIKKKRQMQQEPKNTLVNRDTKREECPRSDPSQISSTTLNYGNKKVVRFANS